MTKPIVPLFYRPLENFDSVKVGEEMGDRVNPTLGGELSVHEGIDLIPSKDLRVFAAHDGVVDEVGYQLSSKTGKGLGNYIAIKSSDGTFYTRYAHLAELPLFTEGQEISEGPEIGVAGNSGGVAGTHLHFEILNSTKQPINPRQSLAAAFPEFSPVVSIGGLQGDLSGDQNNNILIGNSEPNHMLGLTGLDTYYVNFGDTITDADSNGFIVIADNEESQSVALSGKAKFKTDYEGNKIEDQWTLNGFDLTRVGSDLAITKSGMNPSDSSANKITIESFPFSETKAFGISLGKVPDFTVDASGNKVYLYEQVTKSYPFLTSPLYQTKDARGRLTGVTYDFSFDYSASRNIGFYHLNTFNEDGDIVGKVAFPPNYNKRSGVVCAHEFDQDGNPQKLFTFGTTEWDDYKFGVMRLDVNSGKVMATYMMDQMKDGQLQRRYSTGIARLEDGPYFVYVKGDNGYAQKIDGMTLELIGVESQFSPGSYNGNFMPSSLRAEYHSYTLPDGTQIDEIGTSVPSIRSTRLKLRDPLPSEVVPNYSIAPGDVAITNSSLAQQLVTFERSANSLTSSQLKIIPAPNTVISISGLTGNSGGSVGSKIDISDFGLTAEEVAAFTSATNQGQYSFDDLLSGKHQASAQRRMLQETITDDDYRTDDYATNVTIPSSFDNPARYTILSLPNNQTVIFTDVSQQELIKNVTQFFAFIAAPTINPSESPTKEKSPSSQPSNKPFGTPSNNPLASPLAQPSRHPAGELIMPSSSPSGLPLGNPTIQPSQKPFANPTVLPTRKKPPSLLPSNDPSGTPSREPLASPSEQPSHHPVAGDLIMPSSSPSESPSGNPTIQPSLKPFANPSKIPSFKPVGSPVTDTSEIPSPSPIVRPWPVPTKQPIYFAHTYEPSLGSAPPAIPFPNATDSDPRRDNLSFSDPKIYGPTIFVVALVLALGTYLVRRYQQGQARVAPSNRNNAYRVDSEDSNDEVVLEENRIGPSGITKSINNAINLSSLTSSKVSGGRGAKND